MTSEIKIGNKVIGAGNPVLIQSMTNTDTADVEATVAQINALENAGCEIVRSSVYNMECARAFKMIKERIHIPLVADVHFDHRLAIAAVENGADKLRINPGNIGGEANVRELVACCKMHCIPIRIGVNAGSLESDLKKKYGPASPAAMVESAMRHVRILENEAFYETVISVKASTVRNTVEAYRTLHDLVDYPLHVGITETGTPEEGVVKSAAGIGSLLIDDIGDTIRVSLTDDPVREIVVGRQILKALGLGKADVSIVSCPTCGRTRVDLMDAVRKVDAALIHNKRNIKVAVMGCAVNGPGEAADADIGIAFGSGNGVIFKKGERFDHGTMPEILERMILEANRMINEDEVDNK